jgi:hypothetical protein
MHEKISRRIMRNKILTYMMLDMSSVCKINSKQTIETKKQNPIMLRISETLKSSLSFLPEKKLKNLSITTSLRPIKSQWCSSKYET